MKSDDRITPYNVLLSIAQTLDIPEFVYDPCPCYMPNEEGELDLVSDNTLFTSVRASELVEPYYPLSELYRRLPIEVCHGTWFVNPPYSQKEEWVEALSELYFNLDRSNVDFKCVILLPLPCLEHEFIHNVLDQDGVKLLIRHAKKKGVSSRIKFQSPHGEESKSPPSGSFLLTFGHYEFKDVDDNFSYSVYNQDASAYT